MTLIVDRIENKIAVCEAEDCIHVEIALSELPEGTHEGSVLVKKADGTYVLDKQQEEKRRSEMLSLQENLFKKH
ncbi:MAG: DUF3006 domain-containing protein [Acutalibacteraceae bacterium]